MKEIWPCPKCKIPVPVGAKVCPYCGMSKKEFLEMEKEKVERLKKKALCAWYLISLFEAPALTETEIISQMKTRGYTLNEIKETLNQLVKFKYLSVSEKEGKLEFSLTPDGENFLMEVVVNREKLDL